MNAEFVSVKLFKVKKCSKTSKGFEFLKLTSKPKVLKKSKKSWKVMEFEDLKIVRTLELTIYIFKTAQPCSQLLITRYMTKRKGWILALVFF